MVPCLARSGAGRTLALADRRQSVDPSRARLASPSPDRSRARRKRQSPESILGWFQPCGMIDRDWAESIAPHARLRATTGSLAVLDESSAMPGPRRLRIAGTNEQRAPDRNDSRSSRPPGRLTTRLLRTIVSLARNYLEVDSGERDSAAVDRRRRPVRRRVDRRRRPVRRLIGVGSATCTGPVETTDTERSRPTSAGSADAGEKRARTGPQPSRQSDRSTGRRRGDGVRPGIRPRLAIGRPSISLMSPVKSIGVAPLMCDPTAYESTGAPASLK